MKAILFIVCLVSCSTGEPEPDWWQTKVDQNRAQHRENRDAKTCLDAVWPVEEPAEAPRFAYRAVSCDRPDQRAEIIPGSGGWNEVQPRLVCRCVRGEKQ